MLRAPVTSRSWRKVSASGGGSVAPQVIESSGVRRWCRATATSTGSSGENAAARAGSSSAARSAMSRSRSPSAEFTPSAADHARRYRSMDRLPLLDLNAQHRPLAAALAAAAARVLASGQFILGPEVETFERELGAALGVKEVVGVSSGTDALLALLLAAGISPGDEVVTTPYSFFATAEAIVRLGARPVFADVESETLNLDPRAAVRRFGARTKGLLAVHLFGRTARLSALRDACATAGVPLLEDAAQAIGAAEVGTGLGAALSFFPSKNLGGFGDGGAVVTNDAALAGAVRLLRNHGAAEKMRHERVGGNFRLDELQAALLRVKLPHLA